MFWTAFIYGLSGSLGGSIGLLTFMVMFGMFNSKNTEHSKKVAEESLDALNERNRLSAEMLTCLHRIADSAEVMGKQ